MLGVWMENRQTSWKVRAAWVGTIAVTFAALALAYRSGAAAGPAREAGEAYQVNVLVGVKHPIVQVPVSAGRWVIEGLAAAFAVPFEMQSGAVRALASVIAVALFAIACTGWVWLWRRRRWYAVGLAMYLVPLVLMWGARIKPRYVAPMAPVLFVQLWAGLAMIVPQRWRAKVGGALLAVLVAANLGPYLVEVYLRHGAGDFYDVARRGAFAELVDVGAYVQRHAGKDEVVWVNWPPPASRPPDANFAPDKRIVQFLADREVRFTPGDGILDGAVRDAGDQAGLAAFFAQVKGDWAVVYYSGHAWPSYHLPMHQEQVPWWGLYHRDGAAGQFAAVPVARERGYVREIPGLARR
jgi:hypothetical protein